MTLTKPTLILADRAGTSFALVYTSRPGAGPDAPDLAARGMRRGATVVLRGARRTRGTRAGAGAGAAREKRGEEEEEGGGGGECQVKGWSEGGHKADCKIIKGIRAIWP
ncbi:ccb2df69-2be0-4a46-9755-d8910d770051 [Thermothielavioides terrestris]|uniref:Ccb2df69-2be0-4a46-9755-d8910d770051 n=1 Tax=Thermothielavioides terrestris TaxID=2587410 RepID=A0A3S4ALX5_9PEZI|nr:ccb2df69-2be0-4a46-9755-d8910d770051 [Thermothielavioides terrestris]